MRETDQETDRSTTADLRRERWARERVHVKKNGRRKK